MQTISSGCYVIDADFNVINVNQTAKALYPRLEAGKKCYTCLMGLDAPCGPCPVVRGIQGPCVYRDPIRGIAETVDAVEAEIPGRGLCHMLVFSTVGDEAVYAATLPTMGESLKDLALIKALTDGFDDVMSVDLTADTATMYRHEGKPLDATSVHREIPDYSAGLARYIDKYVPQEDREAMRAQCTPAYFRECLREDESLTVHYRVLLRGQLHYYYFKVVRIGEAGSFDHVVIGIGCEDEEVLNRQRSQELARDLREVEHDSMTGLLTREAFYVNGGKLLKAHPEKDFDLCILHLSNLRMVDHQYGRAAGDGALNLIGALLRELEEDTNCIAYLGDGIFASLTEYTGTAARKKSIADFSHKAMSRCGIKNLSLKWSIYKRIPREQSVEEITEKTRYALSTIRGSIHQDYVEFDERMFARMEREETIEKAFDEALANGCLQAWFQPKYSVKTKAIIGAEALVRWVTPDGRVIVPSEFVPVLEQCGRINRLDEEMFRQVCRLQRDLRDAGKPVVPISVNLSRASMFTEDIASRYAEIAASFGVAPALIPIEITESAAVRAIDIQSFASDLISHGFVLHMDDFGSGYSSLASLQIIPFESIKLDKSLIDFIGRESADGLLKHTVAFAKECGKQVVAEGVETHEQYLFLKVIGCDAVQGYCFSRPVPKERFVAMLTENEQPAG